MATLNTLQTAAWIEKRSADPGDLKPARYCDSALPIASLGAN